MSAHPTAMVPLEHAPSAMSQTRRRVRSLELQDVVVTGVGVLLPGCDEREQFWEQLANGRSQLRIETDTLDHTRRATARVLDFDPSKYLHAVPEARRKHWHREQLFYLCSVVQAANDAGIDLAAGPHEAGLFDGTSRSSFAFWHERLQGASASSPLSMKDIARGMPGQAVGLAAACFGFTGPTFTFNGSCASGLIAIGNAYRELQSGRIEVAFASGHDAALIDPLFQMYGDAGLLSAETDDPASAISPFSRHGGNAFGEGAVTLVMETRRHAERRGATPIAEVCGFRHGNGGQHPTEVDFMGDRPSAAIFDVLDEGETNCSEVGFVLGHGNGVRASDISELNYMRRVFGDAARTVPLISTKPIYGHTLGASSAVNAAAAALMLQRDYVIPTVGVDERHTVRGFNHQANVGASATLEAGLIVAYGIGGQNAVLLLRKAR